MLPQDFSVCSFSLVISKLIHVAILQFYIKNSNCDCNTFYKPYAKTILSKLKHNLTAFKGIVFIHLL